MEVTKELIEKVFAEAKLEVARGGEKTERGFLPLYQEEGETVVAISLILRYTDDESKAALRAIMGKAAAGYHASPLREGSTKAGPTSVKYLIDDRQSLKLIKYISSNYP
jgi:hypothetical protein